MAHSRTDVQNHCKSCSSCSLSIPSTAKLCSHCNSYQDFRRHLSVSNTALALVIALVSVITTALPVISDALRSDNSRVRISTPVARGKQLLIMATNTGARPGVIQSAAIHSSMLSAMLHPHASSDGLVESGSEQIIFDVQIRMSPQTARRQALLPFYNTANIAEGTATIQKLDIRGGTADVVVVQYDGSSHIEQLPLSIFDIGILLHAHADQCEESPLSRQHPTCRDDPAARPG